MTTPPLEIPVLSGPSVTLRPHTLDDLEPIVERCVDPESVRWTTVPVDYTEEMARDYLTAIIEPSPELLSWAIEQDGAYVGTLDLRLTEGAPADELSGDVGFVTHPRARGRGVMTGAVSLAVGHALDTLGWERVVWQCHLGNVASYKPMWRNGFPQPVAVPALLNQRGRLRDGWHSVLEPGMARTPARPWDEVHARLLDDVASHRSGDRPPDMSPNRVGRQGSTA